MDDTVIEGAGRYIAKVWGESSARQRITLLREEGWPRFPNGWYIEIEFAIEGKRTQRVHGRVVRIHGDEMVIDGHIASHPTKVWSVP